MAEVYLARRRAGGVEKLLVVKRIRAERTGDARFLDLFVREARLSMSLAHQNIVPVFDFGRTGDQVFLAMERIEGKDLGSSLARAGRDRALPPLLAAFVAAECCQALDYAHHRKTAEGAPLGIVHRDVTPRNVLLSWSGEVKLTDFGIAALAGEDSSRLLGTPAFMAPEQARGEPLDVRADVYAIGLVLREAVTAQHGRPGGGDRDAVLAAARSGALEPWPEGVPETLVAIVDRATAVNRDDRYPDVRSMLEALDTFIVGERAANKSDAPARQLAAWLGRVWDGARDEPIEEATPEQGHLVSFLDDGLDAAGTGTERSFAATVADDGPSPEPVRGEQAAPPPEPARHSPRLALWFAGGSLLAATAVVIAIAVSVTSSRESRGDRAVPAPAVERPVVAVERPSPPIVERRAVIDPPVTPPPIVDRRVPDAPVTPRDRPPPRTPVDRTVAKPPPVVPVVPAPTTRRVTIGSTPWSNFTVDGDPKQHETPQVLDLAPGPHRIRFTNPQLKLEREVTITVPADRDWRHVEDLRP